VPAGRLPRPALRAGPRPGAARVRRRRATARPRVAVPARDPADRPGGGGAPPAERGPARGTGRRRAREVGEHRRARRSAGRR